MDEKRAFIWLRLLGNLTFSQEGQKMLLKAPGGCLSNWFGWYFGSCTVLCLLEGVSTVLSFAASKSNAVCALAILVIRNICFSSYGRSVVLHDGKIQLSFPAKALESILLSVALCAYFTSAIVSA